jgi:hypothetical protein
MRSQFRSRDRVSIRRSVPNPRNRIEVGFDRHPARDCALPGGKTLTIDFARAGFPTRGRPRSLVADRDSGRP